MFLSSLIKELCRKEENIKAGYVLTLRGQCISFVLLRKKYFFKLKFLNNLKHSIIIPFDINGF